MCLHHTQQRFCLADSSLRLVASICFQLIFNSCLFHLSCSFTTHTVLISSLHTTELLKPPSLSIHFYSLSNVCRRMHTHTSPLHWWNTAVTRGWETLAQSAINIPFPCSSTQSQVEEWRGEILRLSLSHTHTAQPNSSVLSHRPSGYTELWKIKKD